MENGAKISKAASMQSHKIAQVSVNAISEIASGNGDISATNELRCTRGYCVRSFSNTLDSYSNRVIRTKHSSAGMCGTAHCLR